VAAAHRAQADAAEIEAQAKRRLADEYDAAQERGEVAKLGSNQHEEGVPHGNTLATVTDLGLTRKQVHEARQIRNAEAVSPGIVRHTCNAHFQCKPTRMWINIGRAELAEESKSCLLNK
jgi:hypothetical protein